MPSAPPPSAEVEMGMMGEGMDGGVEGLGGVADEILYGPPTEAGCQEVISLLSSGALPLLLPMLRC